MAEHYVKPGNPERGWNDPPQFSYGLQTAGGGKRTPLNKRVPAPLQGCPAVPPAQSLSSSTPPMMPPPSSSNIGPPPLGQMHRIDPSKQCSSETGDGGPIDIKDILDPLNQTLEDCKDSVKPQVLTDIRRRLTVLEEMWNTGKLSISVRKRMSLLVKELKSQSWDSADEIHRSLMVDHVNEVSQWMVGVKRLIAEARNLPQEPPPTKDETPTDSTTDASQQEG